MGDNIPRIRKEISELVKIEPNQDQFADPQLAEKEKKAKVKMTSYNSLKILLFLSAFIILSGRQDDLKWEI